MKCAWCGVEVRQGEAAGLFTRFHRWCVGEPFRWQPLSIEDAANVRRIRRLILRGRRRLAS